jgi:hypothetical protein
MPSNSSYNLMPPTAAPYVEQREKESFHRASDYVGYGEEKANSSKSLRVFVTAPSTLQAGYTFEAEIHGDPEKVITCEVVSPFEVSLKIDCQMITITSHI